MTLKQAARKRFLTALEAYKEALRTKTDIVGASVRVHAALGVDGVPKSWKTFVNKAFKEAQTPKQRLVELLPDPYRIMQALSPVRTAQADET